MKPAAVSPWTNFMSPFLRSNETPPSTVFHLRRKLSCRSFPSYKGHSSADLLSYRSTFKMRSCAPRVCQSARRVAWNSERVLVKLHPSALPERSGPGIFRVNVQIWAHYPCSVWLCVGESAHLPFAIKPPWPTKRPRLSITHNALTSSSIQDDVPPHGPLLTFTICRSGPSRIFDQSNGFSCGSAWGQHLKRPTRWGKIKKKMGSPVTRSTNKSLRRRGFLPTLAILWGWSGVLTTIQPRCLE